MKCRDFEGHLSAYVAEETDPGLRRSIAAHLKGCKKCRARVAALKTGRGGQKRKKEAAALTEDGTSLPQQISATALPIDEFISIVWRRPVEMAVTIVLIGGTFFLYQRGASDLKADVAIVESDSPPVAEALALSAPAENIGAERRREVEISPPPPARTVSSDPPAPLPMKLRAETTQSLSKEGRRQSTPSEPPSVKLLLISRNIKEAADSVASQGKVLRKKEDEMEAKVVLLIPAERYETFSQSLQSLGLVKDLSKKPLLAEGALTVEVMIE